MLKHFLTVAGLGLVLGLGAMNPASAAMVSPADLGQAQKAVDTAVTPVHGGWWAVPVIVGGVILFHELHREPCCCYRKCWTRNGRRYCRRYC